MAGERPHSKNAHDEPYGYPKGYQDGYADGFERGKKAGWREGYIEGFEACLAQGGDGAGPLPLADVIRRDAPGAGSAPHRTGDG
jgi:hypothetical protein